MKLSGIRVIDLSMFIPGPLLSMTLADHGAEVIEIETPDEGDPTRHIGLADGPHTVYFRNLNRGKKSVVVNLKDTVQREQFLTLCETADIFIEAFRPGVADRLGVDYETLRHRNPRLIYCSISAFGQTGPYRTRPAHEIAAEALSGVLSITVGQDGKPTLPGLPVGDLLSGLYGLSAILMALYRRATTGMGDRIDISLMDSIIGGLTLAVGPVIAEGRQPDPHHERTTGGAAFYRLYETSDRKHIALAGQEPKFIHVLLGELGRPDLAPLCMNGPGPQQQPVIEFLQAEFRRKTRDEWDEWLAQRDLCYGPVKTFPEAFADPQLTARDMILHDLDGRVHLGTPIKFEHEPGRPNLVVPGHGEHTGEYLSPDSKPAI